jgi:hypothetical protein
MVVEYLSGDRNIFPGTRISGRHKYHSEHAQKYLTGNRNIRQGHEYQKGTGISARR